MMSISSSSSSSSSQNSSLLPLLLNSTSFSFYETCMNSAASNGIFALYTSMYLLLLPLFLLLLSLGLQRRRQHPLSHFDVFTLHMVALEMVGVLGALVYCLGTFLPSSRLLYAGVLLNCIIFPGQTLFHGLTCLDRYLAVVHPVSYVRLRQARGVRLRNLSVVCVWLLCVGWMLVTWSFLPDFPVIPHLLLLSFASILILYFCVAVLRVLTRTGPGDNSRAEPSRQRAFTLICGVLAVLLLRFLGLLVSLALAFVPGMDPGDLCALMDGAILLFIPSSLVLPLLYLHKIYRPARS